jgi:2,4-dienoyl-CoA reductase-like NADH-dependent reductase (Old Yellow Enzyme family)
MNPLVNDRTDRYSGDTVGNRLRFTLAVIDAVVRLIGAGRVGIRISPYGKLFDMPLHPEIDSTYIELVKEIGQRKLAFVHVMNQSGFSRLDRVIETEGESGFNGFLRKMKPHLSQTALILAGGMTREHAKQKSTANLLTSLPLAPASSAIPTLSPDSRTVGRWLPLIPTLITAAVLKATSTTCRTRRISVRWQVATS